MAAAVHTGRVDWLRDPMVCNGRFLTLQLGTAPCASSTSRTAASIPQGRTRRHQQPFPVYGRLATVIFSTNRLFATHSDAPLH
ncbi:MAG: hypothetical protein H6668_02010 [Ardenticatenaceae bacterium]|nr:hypothetical protein [Ardenticatenaceae bacterium]